MSKELIEKLRNAAKQHPLDAPFELFNEAADALEAKAELRESLADPEAVLVNMMRGTIARPSVRAFSKLFGSVVNDEDARLLEIAELREECERLRKAPCECGAPVGFVSGEKYHAEHERLRDCRAERDTLRQQLAERDAQIASMRAEVTPFIETHWMPVARQRDKLAGLLREADDWLCVLSQDGGYSRTKELSARIDAALAEVNK